MSQLKPVKKNPTMSELPTSTRTRDVDSFAPDEPSTHILKQIREEGVNTE